MSHVASGPTTQAPHDDTSSDDDVTGRASGVQLAADHVETWSVAAHLRADGGGVSVLATFARRAPDDGAPAHLVSWAMVGDDDGSYRHATGVDAVCAAECLARIADGRWSSDARLDRAIAEVLRRGGVPRPDELLSGPVRFAAARPAGSAPADHGLIIELGAHGLRTDERGHHHLVLGGAADATGCALVLEPGPGPASRCVVRGVLRRPGRADGVVEGVGRVVGVARRSASTVGALRLDLHLDDGQDLRVEPGAGAEPRALATLVDRSGSARAVADLVAEPLEVWRSTRTFRAYRVRWRLRAPSIGLDVEVAPPFPDQELVSLVGAPTAWVGRVGVTGVLGGRAATGVGAMVAAPQSNHLDLESFFRAVGATVRESVARALPRALDRRTAELLVGGPGSPRSLDGVDLAQLSRTLIAPIRDVVDRGGKAWRSYAAIACCDLVGGDSRRFVQWLAMPELLHVGSLIVDDVQDRSDVRRGGPAAHLVHGEAQAINAGTAAYFLTQRMLAATDHLDPRQRLVLYDLYFEAMRAGHAGQAIDLDGLDDALGDAVASGDGAALVGRVLAVHRLKTAVPAACLARMGAVAGGGTSGQIRAVGAFFEALGLAFQIVDDVLNLRGFAGDLKSRGEDVAQGKVTLPVAEAMGRLDAGRRAWLATTLRARPQEPALIAEVIAELERCGAVEACLVRARGAVEEAWGQLDVVVEDSLQKIMLRAFGWFVLERHY